MPQIQFIGRVLPAGSHVMINNCPLVSYTSAQFGYKTEISVTVTDSIVTTVCNVDKYDIEYLSSIYIGCVDVTQTLVNLAGFSLGTGLIVSLDHWIDPDGNISELNFNNPLVSGLCTAFSGDRLNDIIHVVFSEPHLFMALNDLILAITLHNHTLINCARSVEAIRHMIAGHGTDPKKAWPIMCSALNIDRAYLSLITDSSTKHRHGNIVEVSGPIVEDVTKRSWTIMDRFLHYRLAKSAYLPLAKFPLLRG